MRRPGEKGWLTIGMPTYDDFNGVYFTLKSLQIYHTEIFEKSNIVVVDNNPGSKDGIAVKNFVNSLKKYNISYYEFGEPKGAALAKSKVFELAPDDSKWVLVMDCHIQLYPDSLKRLEEFCKTLPEDDKNIYSGPLVMDDNTTCATHFIRKWRGAMLGIWGYDKRGQDPNAEPFEVVGSAAGLFFANKEYWPGFNPHMKGFGGEEIYIHEKYRRNGGVAICLPFLRWSHRFGRPGGVPYPLLMWQRVRNYVIIYQELGWDVQEVYDYFIRGGFFSEQDWKILMEDPINNDMPPRSNFVAEDAPELEKIIKSIKVENASDLDNIVKSAGITIKKEPVNSNTDNNKDSDEMQSKRPKWLEAVSVENPRPGQMQEAANNLPTSIKPDQQKKSGCSGCGKNKKIIQPRNEILSHITKVPTLEQLYELKFPNNLGNHRQILESLVKGKQLILDFGDDPLGTTLTILNNMSQNTLLISNYEDPKFVPELEYLRTLADKQNKTMVFSIGNVDDFNIGKDPDLVVIDTMTTEADYIYNILNKFVTRCTKHCFINKSDKYGAKTGENKPGILPALTKFLVEHPEWSVIKHDKTELGYTYLSKLEEDKPKLPSNIQMASNFTKSLTKHVFSGGRYASQEEVKERLEICSLCEHRSENRCTVCGCYLLNGPGGLGKASWKNESCPLGYWKPEK